MQVDFFEILASSDPLVSPEIKHFMINKPLHTHTH